MHRVQRLLKSLSQFWYSSKRRYWGYLGLVILALLATLGWRFVQTPAANSIAFTMSPGTSQGFSQPANPLPMPHVAVPPSVDQAESPSPQGTLPPPESTPLESTAVKSPIHPTPAPIPLPMATPIAYLEPPQSNEVLGEVSQNLRDTSDKISAFPVPSQPHQAQSQEEIGTNKAAPRPQNLDLTLDLTSDGSSDLPSVAISDPGRPSPSPSRANLPSVKLSGANLSGANLSGANQSSRDTLVSFTTPGLYLGKVVHKVAVDPKEKVIALTFDDGPWKNYTPKVLEILKENQIKATFFWIGLHLELNPKIGKQVVAEGHAIGNHTWHHRYHQMSPDEASAEIEHSAKLMKNLAGVKTNLFRPPGGRLANGLVDYAEMKHQTVVMWSVMPADTNRDQTAQKITEQVLKDAQPGGIVLLHDGGGNREQTVKALPQIIAGLKKKGYEFVTIPELLKYPTITPKIAYR